MKARATSFTQTTRTRPNPLIIKCPVCGKEGRVNEYHQRLKERPDQTRFYVKHENIGGTWGKSKLKRFRRCYFSRELRYRNP